MISKIFKKVILKDEKMDYIFDSRFVKYKIDSFIFKNGISTFIDLKAFVDGEEFGLYTNGSKFKEYMVSNYKRSGVKYTIFEDEQEVLTKLESYKRYLKQDISNEEIIDNICKYLNGAISQLDCIFFLFKLHKNYYNIEDDFYLSIAYDYLLHEKYYVDKIEEDVNSIDNMYYSLSLSNITNFKELLDIYIIMGIDSFGSLMTIDKYMISALFIMDLDYLLENLRKFSESPNQILRNDKDDILSELDEREIEIIKRRINFLGKSDTLETIGNEYGVTRERIRQVEAKLLKKLKNQNKFKDLLIESLYYKLKRKNRNFISISILANYIKDDFITNLLILHVSNHDLVLKYDNNLKCIYDSEFVTPEEIEDSIIKRFGNVVLIDETIENDCLYSSVIKNDYRQFRENYYLKKKCSGSALYINVINENFPNGFRPGDQNDYDKLKEKVLEKYPFLEEEYPNVHTLNAMFDRNGLILCDRGTYIDQELAVTLSEELVNHIIGYIYENSPMVYYKSIFDKFSRDLEVVGVNNYYYLKGVIDPYLPEDCFAKRDYISIGEGNHTAYTVMIDYIKSFDGIFSLTDIQNKFPGVNVSVFMTIIYEEMDKNLINIDHKKFIYFDKLNIDISIKDELKEIIEKLFVQLDTDTISVSKLYSKIKIFNSELYDKLKLNYGSYYLFSLVKYLFKDEYNLSRPMISNNFDKVLNHYALIKDFVESRDEVDYGEINNFVAKHNFIGLYSYLEFIGEMAGSHVQIDKDRMAKKEVLCLDEQKLIEIDKSIALIIKNFGDIDTSTFKAFQLFPKLKYDWNKYLLAGIVRSYLSDKYELINTDNKYATTEFIIRRCNNE